MTAVITDTAGADRRTVMDQKDAGKCKNEGLSGEKRCEERFL